jgi:hypothetical protein
VRRSRHYLCRITLVPALDILLKIPLLLRQLLVVLSWGSCPVYVEFTWGSVRCLFTSDPFITLPHSSTLGLLVGCLSGDLFCWFVLRVLAFRLFFCRCISLFSALCYSLPCFRDNFPACFTGFLTVTRLAILIFPPKFQGVMWCGSVYSRAVLLHYRSRITGVRAV